MGFSKQMSVIKESRKRALKEEQANLGLYKVSDMGGDRELVIQGQDIQKLNDYATERQFDWVPEEGSLFGGHWRDGDIAYVFDVVPRLDKKESAITEASEEYTGYKKYIMGLYEELMEKYDFLSDDEALSIAEIMVMARGGEVSLKESVHSDYAKSVKEVEDELRKMFPDLTDKQISDMAEVASFEDMTEAKSAEGKLEKWLDSVETEDYQRRGGNYPRSGVPVRIESYVDYKGRRVLYAEFKGTSERFAERWVKEFCRNAGFPAKEIDSEQEGDYDDDWVTVTAVFEDAPVSKKTEAKNADGMTVGTWLERIKQAAIGWFTKQSNVNAPGIFLQAWDTWLGAKKFNESSSSPDELKRVLAELSDLLTTRYHEYDLAQNSREGIYPVKFTNTGVNRVARQLAQELGMDLSSKKGWAVDSKKEAMTEAFENADFVLGAVMGAADEQFGDYEDVVIEGDDYIVITKDGRRFLGTVGAGWKVSFKEIE